MKKLTLFLLTAATGIVPAALLSAQDVTGEDLLFLDLNVVTASKSGEKLKDAPATMMVVTQKEIRERGYRDLKDVLKDLPGIDLTPNIGGEAGGWMVLQRGIYGNNKLQVLVDGSRLNPASGDRFVWGNNLPLADVERIEVLYGPASALYGADAFAGIINIITRSGGYGSGHEASLGYGNVGTKDGSYQYGNKFENGVALRVSGRFYQSDGFDFKKEFPHLYGALDTRFQATSASRDFEAPVKDYNFHAKVDYKDVAISVLRSHYHENNTRGEQVNNYVMDKDAFWAFDKDIISLKHKMELSDKVGLNTTLTYDRYVVDPDSDYSFWWGHAHKYAESKKTSLEEQLNIRAHEKLDITVGMEAAETANLPYNFDLSSPIDNDGELWFPNPTYGYVVNGTTVQFTGQGEVSVRTFGAYGQFKYSPADDLHFTAGGRYDYNSFYGHKVFNPRAGVVYQPGDKATVKMLYGQAFISPSMWSNSLFWVAPTYGHVSPGELGLKLDPEKLTSVEGDLSYQFTPDLLATAAVYRHVSKDILTNAFYGAMYILDTPTSGASRGIETTVNLGKQTVTGADLTADYKFRPKWRANASYSYITGTIDTDGTKIDLPKVSRHKAAIGVTGEFKDHFGIYVREKLVGEIQTMPSNNYVGSDYGGDNTLKAYMMTDIYLRAFKFVEGMEFFMKIDNLFNKKAYGANVDNENDAYGNVFPKIPLDPRTVMVGMSYKF